MISQLKMYFIDGSRKPSLFPILLFFFISLIPIFWLRNEIPIGFGDSGISMFYNFNFQLITRFFIWSAVSSTGAVNPTGPMLIPFDSLYSLLEIVGANSAIVEGSALGIILFFSLVFSYLFIVELFEDHERKYEIALFSSLFYAIGPLTIFTYWYRFQYSLYILPIAPLLFLILIKSLKKKRLVLYSLLMGTCISVFSVCFINAAYMMPVFGILVAYAIFYYFIISNGLKSFLLNIKNLILFFSIVITINMWWILPYISSFFSSYQLAKQAINPLQTLVAASDETRLYSLFQMVPSPYDGRWLWKLTEWKDIYHNSILFILLSFCFILIIMIPVLMLNKMKTGNLNNKVIFFGVILIFGIFLSNGLRAPLGGIFLIFFNYIPLFDIFRDPHDKFAILILIGATPLFGIGMAKLSSFFKCVKSTILQNLLIFLLVFTLFCIVVFPFWNGQLLASNVSFNNGNYTDSYAKVPDYYNNVSLFLSTPTQNNDFRIISLPLSTYDALTYKWDYGYAGGDISWLLYQKSTISSQYFGINTVGNTIQNAIIQNKSIVKLCQLLNTKYVLINHDIDPINGNYATGGLIHQDIIERYLLTQPNITLERSIRTIDFYKISDDHFLPHIYTANQYTFTQDIEKTVEYIDSNAFTPGDRVIFTNDTMNNQKLTSLSKIPAYHIPEGNPSMNLNINDTFWKIIDPGPSHMFNPVRYNALLCNTSDCSEFTLLTSPNQANIINATTFASTYDYHPSITIKNVNPTRYEVHINATQPFFLVFSESYDPQWKVYVEKHSVPINKIVANYSRINVQEATQELKFTPGDISYLLAKPLPEDDHFLVNGYANAWYIDPSQLPKDADGNINITLYFWPQSLFYLGLLISGTTLICCIGYLMYDRIRGRRKNEGKQAE